MVNLSAIHLMLTDLHGKSILNSSADMPILPIFHLTDLHGKRVLDSSDRTKLGELNWKAIPIILVVQYYHHDTYH